MIKAAQWTTAIVGGMGFETVAAMYLPEIIVWMLETISGQITLGIIGVGIAYASVKIDEWRVA